MAGANNNILRGYDERRGEEDVAKGTSLKGEEDEVSQSPTRKKQKRNKPTLSCLECVERKTKVWRFISCGASVSFANDMLAL